MKSLPSLTSLLLVAPAVLCLTASTFAQAPASPVRTAEVEQREIAAHKPFVGTVMPIKHAVLGSAVDGRVIEFNYEEGDRIEDGAAVAQLLTNTIELQKEAAQAELAMRKAELAELENGTRTEEVQQMQARMLAAEAQVRYLKARRDRAVELYENRKVTSAEVRDEAVAASDGAEQSYLEAKAAYELAVAGPRIEQIARAKAQVAMQAAIVQELEDRIKKYTIRSRFTGFVVKKSTEVGAWATSGGAIAEVAQLDQVDLVANVPEQDIPYVQLGREVTVAVFAYPGRQFTGKVFSITPQADVRARTFPVKIRIKNEFDGEKPVLKAGMMGNVLLQTGERKTALLVPKDAVVLGGRSPMVFAVEKAPMSEGNVVKPIPVTLGVSEGGSIEVTGPLTPGMQVVTQGNERLRPGQTVNILPAPEGPAAGT
ncbi:efflux RND transporter periplasmic adaptor subunit [Bremerella sp. JC817]|uniref:efflux RND transporter periplasmic adaptor subunit n=1 Tax=Bremerella sp. JC817 TaxID=3231756 RepID=UPI00345B19B4